MAGNDDKSDIDANNHRGLHRLRCNSSPDKSFDSLSERERWSRCNLRVSVDNAVLTFFFTAMFSINTFRFER